MEDFITVVALCQTRVNGKIILGSHRIVYKGVLPEVPMFCTPQSRGWDQLVAEFSSQVNRDIKPDLMVGLQGHASEAEINKVLKDYEDYLITNPHLIHSSVL